MTSSLAIRHKTDQDRLAALLAAEVAPMVVPQPRRSLLRVLRDTLGALTGQYAQASASLAADFYDESRTDAGFPGGFTVPIADPVEERISASLEWALQDLADIGVEVGDDVELGDSRLDRTRSRVEGATTRLALSGGRETLIGAAHADPQATGYTRVARPDACAWCAMLATRVFDTRGRIRGVYESRDTALYRESDGGRYHDDCRCSVAPIFAGQGYEPDPHVRAWADLYADSTGEVRGKKKLAAFRAALAAQRRT